jgi:hypothetical protein
MYKTVPDQINPPGGVLEQESIPGPALPPGDSETMPTDLPDMAIPEEIEQGATPEEAEKGYVDEEGQPNATPEEQWQYDTLVSGVMRFMYGPGRDGILRRMSIGRDPAMSIGQITARLGIGQALSAQAAGQKIEDSVLFHAGHEIVSQLAELAEAAGIAGADSKLVDRAFFYALDAFESEAKKRGLINEGEYRRAGEIGQEVAQKLGGEADAERLPGAVSEAMSSHSARERLRPQPNRKVAEPLGRSQAPTPPQSPMSPGGQSGGVLDNY